MTSSQIEPHKSLWGFGPYTLDAEGHLWLGPTAIHLAPLQRRLLLALVRQRGQVLSREKLLQEVWGHDHVSEVSISRTVHGLRRILANGPLGSTVIRTIYGGGYRLEAPIHVMATKDGDSEAGQEGGAGFPTAQTLGTYVEGLVWVRQRDPRELIRAEGFLRRCAEMAPDFTPALLQLCASQLAKYFWGLLPAEPLEPLVEKLLNQAEASGKMASEVLALRVEVLSLLHWQPDLAEARFAGWLPGQLPAGTARHSWARHLLATGRAAEAVRLLEPLLAPDCPNGWLLTAMAWWMQGEHRKAILCLQKQLQIDGHLVAPQLFLSLVLASAGRPAEALGELEASSIAKTPNNELQALAALTLALCGKSVQAKGLLQSALGRGAPELTMTSVWGLTAAVLGEEETASALLERAVHIRCGLAPFLQHLPLLQRYSGSPAIGRFQAGMTKHFRCTF
ncbi:MAG: winged helix-turn-helix domain-containing protein [Cyanobacteriota bacterium]|nr:winged helix-turn-helix domain-containing protein [Cyanobacteriota bacterium]